jgi:hypothetical protein
MINETMNRKNGENRTSTDGGRLRQARRLGDSSQYPRHNSTTARMKWTKEINKIVMK